MAKFAVVNEIGDRIIMKAIVFNPAQMKLLEMMSFVKSQETLAELKHVISDFFAKQAQDEINKLWESGTLTDDKVESFKTLHERTPYKK